MGLQRFPIGGFLGGMNLVDNPYSLKSGEAKLAKNVDISLRDVLGVRGGYSPLEALDGQSSLKSQTKSPTVGFETAREGATLEWVSESNVVSSNNRRAVANNGGGSALTHYLGGKTFKFEIPAGATIVGIKATAEISKLDFFGPSIVVDDSFKLYMPGTGVTGKDEYIGTSWGDADSILSRGGTENLWDLTPTPSNINNSEFGVVISFVVNSVGAARVDHFTLTVYYYEPIEINERVDHMRAWYPGENRFLMCSVNGDVYVYDLANEELTQLVEGTDGTIWHFENMESEPGKDFLWMMNGKDTPRKWDGSGEVETWAGKPPNGTMMRVWKNKMVISGVTGYPQRLFHSDTGNPEAPSEKTEDGGYDQNWIDIRTSEDDVDPVTWLETLNDVLLTFKRKSTMGIYDPTEFAFQRIADVGCYARFQSCVVDDRAYFVNRGGVYSVTATGSLRYESLNIEPAFKGEGPPELEAIDLEALRFARMCARPNGRFYLAVTRKGENSEVEGNDVLLEGYPRLRQVRDEDPRMPWVMHEFGTSETNGISSLALYRSEDSQVDKLVAGLERLGNVLQVENVRIAQLFVSTRDGVDPIEWEWESGFKALLAEEPIERIRRLNLTMKGVLTAQLVGGSVEDEFTFETGEEGTAEELISKEPNSRGRYHALRLSGSSQIETEVYAGEFALRGGKEH